MHPKVLVEMTAPTTFVRTFIVVANVPLLPQPEFERTLTDRYPVTILVAWKAEPVIEEFERFPHYGAAMMITRFYIINRLLGSGRRTFPRDLEERRRGFQLATPWRLPSWPGI